MWVPTTLVWYLWAYLYFMISWIEIRCSGFLTAHYSWAPQLRHLWLEKHSVRATATQKACRWILHWVHSSTHVRFWNTVRGKIVGISRFIFPTLLLIINKVRFYATHDVSGQASKGCDLNIYMMHNANKRAHNYREIVLSEI